MKEIYDLDLSYIYEMANVSPKDTGLKTSLHALYNGKAEGFPHCPKVKVSTLNHGRVPIQLLPHVKLAVKKDLKKEDRDIVAAAIIYISYHLQLFLDHWDGKITDFELISALRNNGSDDEDVIMDTPTE